MSVRESARTMIGKRFRGNEKERTVHVLIPQMEGWVRLRGEGFRTGWEREPAVKKLMKSHFLSVRESAEGRKTVGVFELAETSQTV